MRDATGVPDGLWTSARRTNDDVHSARLGHQPCH
jgi:hypothetical protein